MVDDLPPGEEAPPRESSRDQPRPDVNPAQRVRSLKELSRQDYQQDISLKKKVAAWAMGAAGVQLLVADGVFVAYGVGNDWRIPPEAISWWLGATVVEVIGILTVIARYLFPASRRRGDDAQS